MNKIPQLFFCSLVTLMMFYSLKAQSSTFNAGFVLGINFAELEGDGITDYFGLNAGLVSTFQFWKNSHIGLEFLYSVNGEYILPDAYPNISYGKIQLQHLEVPLYFSHFFEVQKREKILKCSVQAGLAYHHLFNYYLETNDGIDITPQVLITKPSAWHGKVGFSYYITPQTIINLRTTIPTDSALDWTWAVRGIWMFK